MVFVETLRTQFFIAQASAFVTARCGDFQQTAWSDVQLISMTFPYIVMILFYFASWVLRDVYLLVFGMGMTLSGMINVGFQYMLAHEWGPVERCYEGNPSPSTNMMFFAYTAFMVYAMQHHYSVRPLVVCICTWAPVMTAFANMYFNRGGFSEQYYAALLGSAIGWVWQTFVNAVIEPRFPALLSLPLLSWFEYKNGLCRALEPRFT